MLVVTVLVAVNIVLRLFVYEDLDNTPWRLVALSLAIGALTAVGGTIGGSVVYDYGFNVETSGDHPVWHESEEDVFPGRH
jgi:uncharacterized membrane protein